MDGKAVINYRGWSHLFCLFFSLPFFLRRTSPACTFDGAYGDYRWHRRYCESTRGRISRVFCWCYIKRVERNEEGYCLGSRAKRTEVLPRACPYFKHFLIPRVTCARWALLTFSELFLNVLKRCCNIFCIFFSSLISCSIVLLRLA